jgi:hypothetical protein
MLPDIASGEFDRLLYRAFQFGVRVSRKAAHLPPSHDDDEQTRVILRHLAAGRSGLIRQSDDLIDDVESWREYSPTRTPGFFPHDQELAKRILAASPEVLQ